MLARISKVTGTIVLVIAILLAVADNADGRLAAVHRTESEAPHEPDV